MSKNISVLIVEDDIHICFLLETVFDGFQIHTKSVGSLNMAKKELEIYIPTLLLLDNSLPDGQGIDFTEYVKS